MISSYLLTLSDTEFVRLFNDIQEPNTPHNFNSFEHYQRNNNIVILIIILPSSYPNIPSLQN